MCCFEYLQHFVTYFGDNYTTLSVLSAVSAPEITEQPVDQLDVVAGTDAVFIVTATDVVNYQWQIVGAPSVNILTTDPGYTGADTASLTVLAVDSSDAAMYQCVVSNADGPTTSDPAELTVRKYKPHHIFDYFPPDYVASLSNITRLCHPL